MLINTEQHDCKVVAELCANHNGSMQLAKQMIDSAKIVGVDHIKFQKRNLADSVPNNIGLLPHPEPYHAYGKTYLEHRKALEFNIDQHVELKQYCDSLEMQYGCSVWDIVSAKEIASINPKWIKIPSAHCLDFELLDVVYSVFNREVHISTGMTDRSEKLKLYDYYLGLSIEDQKRTVIYHCTTIYPCPFDLIHLLEINKLKEMFGTDSRIGFSNHGYGIICEPISYILGVEYIERHFTLDRALRGSDHAASVEPDGLRRIVRDIKAVEKALTYKDSVSETELRQKQKLGFVEGK